MTSSLSKIEILRIFKDKFIEFIDSLIAIFPEEADLIIVKLVFENQIPIEESMQLFSSRIIQASKMVRERNDDFFLKDNTLFMGIKEHRVVYWKNLWESRRLDHDDRSAIWNWFNLFLTLAEMYTQTIRYA